MPVVIFKNINIGRYGYKLDLTHIFKCFTKFSGRARAKFVPFKYGRIDFLGFIMYIRIAYCL